MFQHLGQQHAQAEGVAGRVAFETADAEDLSQYADASFDAVTCSLGGWVGGWASGWVGQGRAGQGRAGFPGCMLRGWRNPGSSLANVCQPSTALLWGPPGSIQ